MTVAINQAVEAIKTAETTEAIREILLNCGKVKSMVEVYEEVLSEAYFGRVVGVFKEEIANNMAYIITKRRENIRFKELTVEAKFEELTAMSHYDVCDKLHLCTVDEMKTILEMLGADAKEISCGQEWEIRSSYEMEIVNTLYALEKAEKAHDDTQEEKMTMTHDEIVKELREIGKYLQEKSKDIKARYGENPEFANEQDEWHYKLLMQACKTVLECGGVRPYISVSVAGGKGIRDGTYGIEIQSADEPVKEEAEN